MVEVGSRGQARPRPSKLAAGARRWPTAPSSSLRNNCRCSSPRTVRCMHSPNPQGVTHVIDGLDVHTAPRHRSSPGTNRCPPECARGPARCRRLRPTRPVRTCSSPSSTPGRNKPRSVNAPPRYCSAAAASVAVDRWTRDAAAVHDPGRSPRNPPAPDVGRQCERSRGATCRSSMPYPTESWWSRVAPAASVGRWPSASPGRVRAPWLSPTCPRRRRGRSRQAWTARSRWGSDSTSPTARPSARRSIGSRPRSGRSRCGARTPGWRSGTGWAAMMTGSAPGRSMYGPTSTWRAPCCPGCAAGAI